jgi:OmpA-OmpF porin, OOP family
MNKCTIFVLAIFLCTATLSAQNSEFRNAIHAKLNAVDYRFINNDDLYLGQGFEVGLFRNILPFLNIGVPAKVSLARVPGATVNATFGSADLVAHLGDMRPNRKISPYFFGGAGIVKERAKDFAVQFPFGAGLNFKVSQYAFINVQGEMRKSMIDNRDNLQLGFGYVYLLHKAETPPPPPPMPDERADSDGDGVLDILDHCPSQVGLAIALGCPDADADSIADFEDRCPDLPGTLLTMGCPDKDFDGVADLDDKCPDTPGSVRGCPDSDNDGFADIDDKCPNESGRWNGCPDTDYDGVPDKDDKCPNDPGTAENKGCPVGKTDSDGDGFPDDMDKCPNQTGALAGCPDTDGDGFADHLDKCPTESGKLNGCPDKDGDGYADKDDPCPNVAGVESPCPDTDGDGVADNLDKCPNLAGSAAQSGCPEVQAEVKSRLEFAKRAVQFETGRANLKGSSYGILDEIYQIMLSYPDYKLVISGHTDDVGDDARNLTLSTDRAKACQDYFIFKGISPSRLRYLGFGEFKPVADNRTSEGRELNRRVEFEVSFE